jgi:hypothetical protein
MSRTNPPTRQPANLPTCQPANPPTRQPTGLFARGAQYIRRAATNLEGDADTSLVGARRLNASSCLEMYGVAPVVESYYLNHRSEQVSVGWDCESERVGDQVTW